MSDSGTVWDNNIPQEIRDYVSGIMEQYEYADQSRIAIVGDEISMSRYEEIKARGCCGFVDYQKVPFKSGGNEYYYGFNYGH